MSSNSLHSPVYARKSCPSSLACPSLYYSHACVIDSLVCLASRDLLLILTTFFR